MSEEINVSGLNELREALLRDLPESLQGKALQGALTLAAKPIVVDARARVPVSSGRLRRAIYAFRDKTSTPTRQSRLISVRTGKRARKSNKDAFYWKWIEFGHRFAGKKTGRLQKIAGDGAGYGKGYAGPTKVYPAHPFLRPAFEAKKMQALEIVRTELLTQIEKVAAKSYAKSRAVAARAITKAIIG